MVEVNPDKLVKKGQAKPDVPSEGDAAPSKGGWKSWIFGWIFVPALVIGVIFGGGVLVGVHLHDSWLSRLVVWVVELF